MNVHFISIGGTIMHSLAIALKKKGFNVTGSDDEIFDPAKSALKAHQLLPPKLGWHIDNIHPNLDAVILGMHAKPNNPELLKAKELNIPIKSFPEYIYEQSREKMRVVIAGSHGKTTITSMIIHALYNCNQFVDYMVGAKIKGCQTQVELTEKNDTIILEGDEYLSSPIDKRPKFIHYKPQIVVISGIAWDHVNVFPTWEEYLAQFKSLLHSLQPGAQLIYNLEDEVVAELVEQHAPSIECIGYRTPKFTLENDQNVILESKTNKKYPVAVIGQHNLQNMSAACAVCCKLGLTTDQFYTAIRDFTGADKRLQLLKAANGRNVYKDFAHSPSKVSATTTAVAKQFPSRKLCAVLELHTYSSLSPEFITQYNGTLNDADEAVVYFNPHAVSIKGLKLSKEDVKKAFNNDDILIFDNSELLSNHLKTQSWQNTNLLLMSSGNFDNIDLAELSTFVCEN